MTESQFRVGVLGGAAVLWLLTLITYATHKEAYEVSGPQKVSGSSCSNEGHYYEQPSTVHLPKATDEELLVNHISQEYKTSEELTANIVQTVYAYTDSVDFPEPELVLAVMAIESSFRPEAVSPVGALGLMQVMPLHNPGTTIEDNIVTGIWVLQKYRMRVDSNAEALTAYNVGITAFKHGKTNNDYVAKVMSKQTEFTELLKY